MQTTAPKLPSVPPVRFLQEVVAELRRVTWPTRQETIKLTVVVIAVSAIVGIFVGGTDALLVKITSILFKK